MSTTTTSPFLTAMDIDNDPSSSAVGQQEPTTTMTTKQLGENNAPEYTIQGVKDLRVALFFALVRNLKASRLEEMVSPLLKQNVDDAVVVSDLFVMAFQTRHCRGGKGERMLFYNFLRILYEEYPQTTLQLLKLIPHYGSYRDWFQLVEFFTTAAAEEEEEEEENNNNGGKYKRLIETILDLAVEQLQKDANALEQITTMGATTAEAAAVSLLGKWAPREKKRLDNGTVVKRLAAKLFGNDCPDPKRRYRRLVSSLNRHLETTEVKMCQNRWDEIDFNKHVPSICLTKHRKAFLNESLSKQVPMNEEEGNRFPDDPKRVQCRKRLRDVLMDEKASKLKGKQLHPHEIVSKLVDDRTSHLEEMILQHQWNDIRSNVKESMERACAAANEEQQQPTTTKTMLVEKNKNVVDLGKLVALVDVSGSMHGTPMHAAIGLGILVSELADPTFCDRILTFHENPTWVQLEQGASIAEKTKIVRCAPWGGSTDFERAMELILTVAQNAKLGPDEIPSLIVFSDMQFNQANNSHTSWETHYERIQRRFKQVGTTVCGKEWPAPHIIFWNLRGDTTGFPAQSDTPGVTMLSGFSPTLLKLLLSGEELIECQEEEEEDGVCVVVNVKKDPYVTLRAALDDAAYDPVRVVLGLSNEKALAAFEFEESQEEEWILA